jgi:hypothetical protein
MSEFIGQPLTELLRSKMRRDNLSFTELAKRLQIGQSYLSQLSSGAKPLSSVTDSFLRACAEYLGIPVVHAFLLAGRLQYQDFCVAPESIEEQIKGALTNISQSNLAMKNAVGEAMLTALPRAIQVLLIQLYERAEQVTLIPASVSLSEIERIGQLQAPFEVRFNKLD